MAAFENSMSLDDGAFELPPAEAVAVAAVLVVTTVPVPLAMVGDGLSPPAVAEAAMMMPLLVTTAALGGASLITSAGGVTCGEISGLRGRTLCGELSMRIKGRRASMFSA